MRPVLQKCHEIVRFAGFGAYKEIPNVAMARQSWINCTLGKNHTVQLALYEVSQMSIKRVVLGARGAVTGWLYLSVRQRIVRAWSSNGGLHSARSLENDPNPLEMQHSRLRRLHLASLPIVLFSKETKTTSACEGNVTATNCPKHCKTRVFLPEYAFSTAWTCTWRPQF